MKEAIEYLRELHEIQIRGQIILNKCGKDLHLRGVRGKW